MSRIGKAMKALQLGLAHRDDETPMALRYGQLLGAAECALEHLVRVDTSDVAAWISEECCSACGSSEVAVEYIGDSGAAILFCARHGMEHQRQLDWIGAVADLPEARASLAGK